MDTNRVRHTAEWFYSTVFREETILPRPQAPAVRVPPPIRAARSLETAGGGWQSREAVFVKQGKVLANYTDDFVYDQPVVRYYPTYQALTDAELRGYFTWRTKLRRGCPEKTSLSYAFLYIYELLNQIGIADPMEGYEALSAFRADYGALDAAVLPYLDRWMTDYVIYYRLDAALLQNTPQLRRDNALAVLQEPEAHTDAQLMQAVKDLAPKWLERSKFYADHPADLEAVVPRVLRQIAGHCRKHCKKSMIEQYFGPYGEFQLQLFDSAVFCDRQRGRSFTYRASAVRIFQCRGGLWSVQKYANSRRGSEKLEQLVKAVDAALRRHRNYGHPLRQQLDTKWLLALIDREAAACLDAQRTAAANRPSLDPVRLDRIRRDAAITRDRLIVEEDLEHAPILIPQPEFPPPVPTTEENALPLSPPQYRLLQCLLYGRPTAWVQTEGFLLSVLVDGINEALYDTFSDTVLDDTPALVEDYITDLKGMIHP